MAPITIDSAPGCHGRASGTVSAVCQRDGESAYFRFFAFGAAFFTTFLVALLRITPSPL
jgi:hypothetical protein